MFGALLALGVMDTLGWHWYLGLATIPLFMVLLLFPVRFSLRMKYLFNLCMYMYNTYFHILNFISYASINVKCAYVHGMEHMSRRRLQGASNSASQHRCFNLQQCLANSIKRISQISNQLYRLGVCVNYSYHNSTTTNRWYSPILLPSQYTESAK